MPAQEAGTSLAAPATVIIPAVLGQDLAPKIHFASTIQNMAKMHIGA